MLNGARQAYQFLHDVEDFHTSVSPPRGLLTLGASQRRIRNRWIARDVVCRWKDFTTKKVQRRALALSGIRNCLLKRTDEQLTTAILVFVVEFQPPQQQTFEANPHKESRPTTFKKIAGEFSTL